MSICSASDSNDGGPDPTPHCLDRPLWRNKYCKLLNKDFSLLRRAMILVCLPNQACDEHVLDDRDVGVMFMSKHESLQMTTIRWPYLQRGLKAGDYF